MMTIMFIFGVLAVLLFQIQLETISSSESFDNNDEIAKTSISISGINYTVGSNLVNFTLTNEGSEKLWNYDEFDILVTYDADILGTQTTRTEKFTYNVDAFAISNGQEGESPDFDVQRGCTTILAASSTRTISAGVDYNDPVGEAFVRIVNTRLTGNGNTGDVGTTQEGERFSAYISDPDFAGGSLTFTRIGSPAAPDDTLICYEIIDYVGLPDGENAIVVLDQNTATYTSGSTTLSGTSVTPNDPTGTDIVVFITGQASDETGATDWNEALSTSAWNSITNTPDFTRGSTDSALDTNDISYAVVEFLGANWDVNRVEHNYGAASETVSIPAVISVNQAFLHTQHRSENEFGLDEVGEEAWLSAINQISVQMEVAADGPFSQYYIVAWIIENTKNTGTVMNVQHLNTEFFNTDNIQITVNAPADFTAVDSSNTAIIGENARSTGAGTAYPRGAVALELTADDVVTLTRSDRFSGAQGQDQRIRFSLVEFPYSTVCVDGTSNNIAVNEWTINCIKFDYFDPDIVNPNESPEILTKLKYPLFTNSLLNISVSTDKGITLNQTTTVS